MRQLLCKIRYCRCDAKSNEQPTDDRSRHHEKAYWYCDLNVFHVAYTQIDTPRHTIVGHGHIDQMFIRYDVVSQQYDDKRDGINKTESRLIAILVLLNGFCSLYDFLLSVDLRLFSFFNEFVIVVVLLKTRILSFLLFLFFSIICGGWRDRTF